MSRAVRTSSPKRAPLAADVVEEAVHLLRDHAVELAGYYAGTAPFAVGVVYFWAYVAWFMPPDGEIALGALVLAVLFGVMRAAQHRFALRLRARLTGEAFEAWNWRKWRTEIAAQWRLQAGSVVVLPVAAVFGVPFGWMYAYFQSALAMPAANATSAERRVRAWRQACAWPAQNHWGLGLLGILWLMVWLNLAVAFYVVPSLATNWLGLKTVFALSGWKYLNTTFLVLVTVLTHVLVGPLIKAFYVVRVFRGESRTSGADLRLVLRREQGRRRSGVVALALLTVVLAGLAPRMQAQPVDPPAASPVSAPALDRSLDRVLERSEFRWRLRPLPVPPEAGKKGLLAEFIDAMWATLWQVVRSAVDLFHRMERWVTSLFPGGGESGAGRKRDGQSTAAWMEALQVAAFALLVIVAGLLLFVAWKVWRHNRLARPLAGGAGPVPGATPDLRDETVEASRLPAHEWLELARTQLAAGEWRLAWRALFLATIAQHAHEGRVTLAKFKTNLDYERELRRRAFGREALAEEFRGRRRAFEAVWYGRAAADAETAREWLRRLEARP